MNGRFYPLSVQNPSSDMFTPFTCDFILMEQELGWIMQTISLLNTKQKALNLTRAIRDSMHLLDEYASLQKQGAFHPAIGIKRGSERAPSPQSTRIEGDNSQILHPSPKWREVSRQSRETAKGAEYPTNYVLHPPPQSEDVVVAGSEG